MPCEFITNRNGEARGVRILGTNLIYARNFEGNPQKDRFRANYRHANIIIPDSDFAQILLEDYHVNVKITKPYIDPDTGEQDPNFEPRYFTDFVVNFDSKFPPLIYLVEEGQKPVQLDPDSVSILDGTPQMPFRIKNVDGEFNLHYSASDDGSQRCKLYCNLL